MENLLLNIIQSLSDSRFWLGPVLLFCVFIMAVIISLETMEIGFRKIKENNMLINIYKNFEKYFKIKKENANEFIDMISSAIAHEPKIDIIKFDSWLRQQGYEENKHGSMKDYIRVEYGKMAVKFIQGLI